MSLGKKRLVFVAILALGFAAFMGGGYLDQNKGYHALGYVLGIVGFIAVVGGAAGIHEDAPWRRFDA